MPIAVNIDGVGKVNFPDGYTPERIQFAIENDILPRAKAPASGAPGVMEDVAKSLPGAVTRASAALVGLPQTILGLIRKGGDYAAEKMGFSPEEITHAKTITEPGITSAFSKVPNFGDKVTEGYDALSTAVTGAPVYKPKTGPGRVADLTAQTMVSGPGSMLQKGVMGASAGAAGEGGKLAGIDNPIAQGVLQMLGAGAGSLPFILRSVPAGTIDKAIAGITPQHLDHAQALMDDAARRGIRLTGAEAIAQATGKNTLQDVQRVVEGSSKGGPIMQSVMNERPGAVRSAFESEASNIAPVASEPARTPVRMQQAAETALKQARQQGNTAAKPFYDAARAQTLPPAQAAAAAADPALQMAIGKVTKDPLNHAYGQPPDSVAAIDAAKKYLDDVGSSARLAGENARATNAEGAATRARSVGDAASPEYAQARAIVAQNRQNVVNPMEQSPVGDIAQSRGALKDAPAESAMRAQSEILMPQSPRALDPPTIHRTIATIKAQDPAAARDFVSQNMRGIFDEAAQNLSAGANQWGGAKFASQIAGNPRQRDNLQALIEASATTPAAGRQTWNGFNRLLDVLEATGKRQAPGSPTAQNLQMKGDLSAGGAGTLPAAVASPNKALSLIGNWYDNFRFGKNTEEMARILTDPKSVDLMRLLAKEAPDSAKATALVGQIIAGSAGNSGDASNTSR